MGQKGLIFFLSLLFFAGAVGKAVANENFSPVLSLSKKSPLARLDPKKPEDLDQLLQKISGALLGKPYKNGPLGESNHDAIDPDPLYRLDIFDCTTFLETVMANAYCHQSAPKFETCLEKRLRELRYIGGKISFRSRNHIPETDWLPNNMRRGFLEDVNRKIFGDSVVSLKVAFDREQWLAETLKEPKANSAARPILADFNYVPIAIFFQPKPLEPAARALLEKNHALELEKIFGKNDEESKIEKFRAEMEFLKQTMEPVEDKLKAIPSGSILNLVRGKKPGAMQKSTTETIISHQGLVVQKEDTAYIIHAAPNVGHVSQQKLSDYLIRYLKSNKARGISIYKIKSLR